MRASWRRACSNRCRRLRGHFRTPRRKIQHHMADFASTLRHQLALFRLRECARGKCVSHGSPSRARYRSRSARFDDAEGSQAGSNTFYFDVTTATLYDRRTGVAVDAAKHYDPHLESPSLRRRRMREGAPRRLPTPPPDLTPSQAQLRWKISPPPCQRLQPSGFSCCALSVPPRWPHCRSLRAWRGPVRSGALSVALHSLFSH